MQKPERQAFRLLQPTAPYHHSVHVKPCHKLIEIKDLYVSECTSHPELSFLNLQMKISNSYLQGGT